MTMIAFRSQQLPKLVKIIWHTIRNQLTGWHSMVKPEIQSIVAQSIHIVFKLGPSIKDLNDSFFLKKKTQM